MTVVRLQFSVHVLCLVSFVFKVLKTLTIGDIVALKFDCYLVFAEFLQIIGQENPVTHIDLLLRIFVQTSLIYCNTFHIFAFVVDKEAFGVVSIFLVVW